MWLRLLMVMLMLLLFMMLMLMVMLMLMLMQLLLLLLLLMMMMMMLLLLLFCVRIILFPIDKNMRFPNRRSRKLTTVFSVGRVLSNLGLGHCRNGSLPPELPTEANKKHHSTTGVPPSERMSLKKVFKKRSV